MSVGHKKETKKTLTFSQIFLKRGKKNGTENLPLFQRGIRGGLWNAFSPFIFYSTLKNGINTLFSPTPSVPLPMEGGRITPFLFFPHSPILFFDFIRKKI
jgi:hypothetical protein